MKMLNTTLKWKLAQSLELQWWKFYLRKKKPDDYFEKKKSYWFKFLKTCGIGLENTPTCLDAGCGPAGIFIILNNLECDAVDPLLDKYQAQLHSFISPEKFPRITFYNSPLEIFTPAKQYDLVFCINAINHVSDWHRSLQNLWESTKPGGTLLLSSDVHRHSWLKPVFRLFSGDVLHPHQHTLTDYITVLQSFQPASLRTLRLKRQLIFDYFAIVMKKPA